MNKTLALGNIKVDRSAIAEISELNNEPDWMRSLRERAWIIFEEYKSLDPARLRIPGIDLHSLALNVSTDSIPDAPAVIQHELSAKKRAGWLKYEQGCRTQHQINAELEKQGVIFCDIKTALTTHTALFKQYFMTSAVELNANKFTALHAAMMTNGVFVYVPKDVRISLPLQIIHHLNASGSLFSPHLLIVAEHDSEIVLFETFSSGLHLDNSLVNAVTEIHAKEGSRVTYLSLQELGENCSHQTYKRAMLSKDANVHWMEIGWGSGFSRNNVEVVLEQSGSRADMLGLYLASDNQKIEYDTMQIHAAPHCTSDLLYKGALKGSAKTRFEGLIRVNKGAQKTNAYQANRNLLLSNLTQADSVPKLEIEANDVRCTHGATVGPVNQEDLFYLMSRGLSREDATKLLVMGFFNEVLDRIPVDDIKMELTQYLETHVIG